MKKLSLFFLLIINNLTVHSQLERINWMIFIDGQIPQPAVLSGEFICFENTVNERIINFEYLVGDIKIAETDMNFIRENGETIGTITVRLFYQEFSKRTHTKYIYSFDINPLLLFPIYDYVVLRITNLNKKKGIFYYGYSTSNESIPWLSKEVRIFKEITIDIHKKGINNKVIRMERVIR